MENGDFERKIYHEPIPLLKTDWEHYDYFNRYLDQNGFSMPDIFVNDPNRNWLRMLTAS